VRSVDITHKVDGCGRHYFTSYRFWVGAVHAATPGHGKTIAAAYLVGARGRPIDAVILGVFVTLSHTTGIVLVGVLASLGSVWLVPQRIEAYMALATGLLVVALGLWMLWTQRDLLALAMGGPLIAAPAHGAGFDHHHPDSHPHQHRHDDDPGPRDGETLSWHSHRWGTYHSHRLDIVTDRRPKLGVLLALAIFGGILPDPSALAILLAALSSGQVLLGLASVLVFSLGFAATLLVVGVVAAQVGQKILDWLSSIWAMRTQIATTLLILGMGVVLTVKAAYQVTSLAG
jgi:nickel/cobalt transporter (NicO) family protein